MNVTDLPSRDYDELTTGCPFSTLRRLRDEAPLLRLTSADPNKNLVLFTDPADILAIINDPETFSSTDHAQSRRFDSDFTPKTACVYAEHQTNLKPVLVWSDGADHQRVRRLVHTAFSVPRVNAKSPYIQEFVDELIDGFQDGGTLDFVQRYSFLLPSRVITRELGLQPTDVPLVQDITNAISAAMDLASPPEVVEAAADVVVRLHDMLRQRLDNIDALPENCLLRDLVTARIEDTPALTRDELLWLSTLLLAAGGHTSAAMIGWSVYLLAEQPDIQARLRADPSLVPAFVEEALRLHGPVPTTYRTVTRDTRIRDVELKKGSWVIVRWDSVNLDERKFPEPETLDLDRPNIRQHSTFGLGKHFCIGNQLARREMTLTLESLLRRFSDIRFAKDQAAIALIPSFDGHMLAELPLTLVPA